MTHALKLLFLCLLSTANMFGGVSLAPAIIDTATQYDLDLSRPGKESLGSVINKAHTFYGKKAFDTMLCSPLDEIEILKNRQKHTRFLLENESLSCNLASQMSVVAVHEPALIQHHSDPLAQKALESVYFSFPKLKKFNTNPYALDLAYFSHIAGLCAPLAEHVIMHLGIDLVAKAAGSKGHGHHDHEHHHEHHHGCNHHHHDDYDGNSMAYYGLQALHWGLHVPGLYDMGQGIKNRALMIQYIQSQTIHIAQYVQAAEDMYGMLKQHHAATYDFEPFTKLDYFFSENPQCSSDFKHCMSLLKKRTFKGKASVWNHVGNVLAAYRAYGKVENEFALLIEAVSEIDIYLTTAQLVKNQTAQQSWSFVVFNENKNKPILIIEKFSHLFVAHSKLLKFSSKKSLHTLVKGDNGSGKSTYLNGIGHVLILAQTFGIVPATYCEITPFSHIYTFRCIQDDIAAGTSRFYAECARIETIIESVTQSSKFSCVLLDEPFTFTTHEKGSAHLEKALSDIGSLSSTISLVATHYKNFSTALEYSWRQENFNI